MTVFLALASSLLAADRSGREKALEDSNKLLKHLQNAGYMSTSFKSYRNSLHIDVGIDQTLTELCLDTGASYTVLTESFGKRLGLTTNAPGIERKSLGAFGESSRTEWDVLIDKFTLGPVRARNLPIKIRSGAYGMANGLLGLDTLIRFGAIIDFRVGIIHLRKSDVGDLSIDRFLKELGYSKVDLSLNQFAPITIEGRTGWALIDSGAASSIFDKSFVRELKLPGLVGEKLSVSDIRSESKDLEPVKVRKLHVGGHVVPNAIIGVTQLAPDIGPQPFAGLLGMEFLAGNRAVLDCDRGHLYLAKNPGKVSGLRSAE